MGSNPTSGIYESKTIILKIIIKPLNIDMSVFRGYFFDFLKIMRVIENRTFLIKMIRAKFFCTLINNNRKRQIIR